MYAELHALSNFSFLRGASHPEELVEQAKQFEFTGDWHSPMNAQLAGVVHAHVAAREHGLPLIIGTELTCTDERGGRTPEPTPAGRPQGEGQDGPSQLKHVALATDRASYGAMSRLISKARRADVKGRYAGTRRSSRMLSTAA